MLKKILLFLVFAACALVSFQIGVMSQQTATDDHVKLDIPVKNLLAEPVEGAASVYDVPIGMRVTGRTSDNKWYKVKVSYNFLGYFEYEGWCKVY